MHYYGWIMERSVGSFIVGIITENGIIHAAFEARSYKNIQDLARKFVPQESQQDFLWVDRLYDSVGFQQARAAYDRNNPIPFGGRIYEQKTSDNLISP